MAEEQKTVLKEGQAIGLVSEEPIELSKWRAAEEPILTGAGSKRGSQLFTVRMWPEPLDEEHVEWRGRVDHVATGEGYYFRDWSRLAICIEKMLHAGWRTGSGVG